MGGKQSVTGKSDGSPPGRVIYVEAKTGILHQGGKDGMPPPGKGKHCLEGSQGLQVNYSHAWAVDLGQRDCPNNTLRKLLN